MLTKYDKILKEIANGAEWAEVKEFDFRIQDDGSLAVIYMGCGSAFHLSRDPEDIAMGVNRRRMQEAVNAIKRVVKDSHYGWPQQLDYLDFIDMLPEELEPLFSCVKC